MSNIALYKGTFQYNLANIFVEKMGNGFKALGHNITYIDLNSTQIHEQGNLLKEKNIDYAIAFNGINRTPIQKLCEALNIKYIAIFIDHPYHHLPRIDSTQYMTMYDSTHLDYVKKLKFNDKKYITLLHHGGDQSYEGIPKKQSERTIPILFPGTFSNPDYYFKCICAVKNSIVKDLLLEAIEIIITSDSTPLENILAMLARKKGIHIENNPDIYREFTACLLPLDGFMRAYKRLHTLLELDKNDIPVTIYGNHWPTNLFKNHIIKGNVPYDEVVKIMDNAKIVLNMPFFPNGSHERLFTSALNGAIPLTDENPYVKKIFGDAIIPFKFTEREKMPITITQYLENSEKMEEMSLKCQEIAQHHTWEKRAEELLAIFKQWGI